MEFIDMEHTPKNILIRAVKKGAEKRTEEGLRQCMQAWGAKPLLDRLLHS